MSPSRIFSKSNELLQKIHHNPKDILAINKDTVYRAGEPKKEASNLLRYGLS